MSGWTILTVRGRPSKDYERAEYESGDRYQATADLTATFEEDSRVRGWTTWKSHVYAYLECSRYNFEFAELLMEDYSYMIDDAVVLGANDTSDQGTARYYSRPDLKMWTDQYEETEHGYVGELALSVMNARHNIIARDPWHNNCDEWGRDERYLGRGTSYAIRNGGVDQ